MQHAQEFIAIVEPLALEIEAKYGIPHGICIAQAALETGWGRYVYGNNYFGIKGEGQKLQTQEYVDGAKAKTEASFRIYESMEDSFHDYGRLLTTFPRYQNALQASSPRAFARKLQAAGYATDPEYANKLIAIMEKWHLM